MNCPPKLDIVGIPESLSISPLYAVNISLDLVGTTSDSSSVLDELENFTKNVPLFGFTESLVLIFKLDVNAENPIVSPITAISNISSVFIYFFLVFVIYIPLLSYIIIAKIRFIVNKSYFLYCNFNRTT